MLQFLPERIHDNLDRIIHGSMAVAVTLTGLSLENLVLIIPAIVSVVISILAWLARRQDRKRRFEIYKQQEERRTKAMEKYLESQVEQQPTAVKVMVARRAMHAACCTKKENSDGKEC